MLETTDDVGVSSGVPPKLSDISAAPLFITIGSMPCGDGSLGDCGADAMLRRPLNVRAIALIMAGTATAACWLRRNGELCPEPGRERGPVGGMGASELLAWCSVLLTG